MSRGGLYTIRGEQYHGDGSQPLRPVAPRTEEEARFLADSYTEELREIERERLGNLLPVVYHIARH